MGVRKWKEGGCQRQRDSFGVGAGFGNALPGDGLEFAADDVGWEAGAKETAIERGELLINDFAAKRAQLALDALADKRSLIDLLRGFFERGFDVAVSNAARPQIAGDAESALLAGLRAVPDEQACVAAVVDQPATLQPRHDLLYERLVFAAALERLLHFMDGMRAAHEYLDGGVVQLGFGVNLAGLKEHEGRIEQEASTG